MKRQQVRELFPDQFVLLSVLDYTEQEDRKNVTEVATIRAIPMEEANKAFFIGGICLKKYDFIVDLDKLEFAGQTLGGENERSEND